MDVEVGYPLLLNNPTRLDRERLGIACHSHLAIRSRMEVVYLLSPLIANLGASVRAFGGPGNERVQDAVVLSML